MPEAGNIGCGGVPVLHQVEQDWTRTPFRDVPEYSVPPGIEQPRLPAHVPPHTERLFRIGLQGAAEGRPVASAEPVSSGQQIYTPLRTPASQKETKHQEFRQQDQNHTGKKRISI
jgi:hypothetical protein